MNLDIFTKAFTELTTVELYELLKLRNEIFIVEQNCAYLDIDDKDQNSYHLFILDEQNLVGYSRILPAGVSYNEVAFGRVAISNNYRGKGLGKLIVEESIKSCNKIFGNVDIKIGAQLHLVNLYESFDFKGSSEPYDEDGIMHIDMIRQSTKT